MEIIVRENKPLVIARVGQWGPRSGDAIRNAGLEKIKKQGFASPKDALKFLYPTDSTFNISSVGKLLYKINSTQSYSQLPDIIQFDYNKLQEEDISLDELSSAINFSYKMSAKRLGEKSKHVTLTGRVIRPITYKFKEELEKNNFAGGVLAAVSSSLEDLRDNIEVWKKDNGHWDKRTFQNKIVTANTFDLTFRQEQILQLIKTRGLSNAQIANMLKISESTVKMHVGLILKKYGLKTRLQLVTVTLR